MEELKMKMAARVVITITVLLFLSRTALADKTGEIVTAKNCQARGFEVEMVRTNEQKVAVSVKIDKDARRFEKTPQAHIRSEDLDVTLHVVVDSHGDRWVSFAMTQVLLDKSELLIGSYTDIGQHWCIFRLKDFPKINANNARP